MTNIPPDWVLIEAAKRSEITEEPIRLEYWKSNYGLLDPAFRALCDMIHKYEQPPVDRKLLCAEEAYATPYDDVIGQDLTLSIAVRAIELWEEGFGK